MKQVKLAEISKGKGNYGIGASAVNYRTKYKYLRITDISNDGKFRIENLPFVDDEKASKYLLYKNDIVFARTGNSTGRNAIISEEFTNLVYAGFLIKFSLDEEKCFPKYVSYFCQTRNYYGQVASSMTGSTRGNMNVNHFSNILISLPTIEKQKEIADRISVYDDKIENNNKIITTLEEMASLLYKRYFVDFEFPNDEGKPYKSNGGQFIDSELGRIPIGWEVKRVKDYVNVATGKKNANAASEKGKYKFFTCSQKDFLTDEYCFDGNAILIAGNGDFSVKKYNGKFDAYQRTYVLIPEKEENVDWLYWHIKINLDEITQGHRGSVIKFITKGMITDEVVFECNSVKIKQKFENINNLILGKKKENEILEKTRDLLINELIK